MCAKIPLFAIFVEAVICLLLYNLHDCTFKDNFVMYLQNPLITLEAI